MTSALRSIFRALVALSLVTGCGGGTTDDPDAAARADAATSIDAGTAEDGGSLADATISPDASAADGGADPCDYVDTIDRSCATDIDCAVRLHQTDCCGSSAMIGIASSAAGVYLASEPACQASYPDCACPAMLPTTDSGETATDTSAVQAACVERAGASVCLTYVTMRPTE